MIEATSHDKLVAQYLSQALKEEGLTASLSDASIDISVATDLIVVCSESAERDLDLTYRISQFLKLREHSSIMTVSTERGIVHLPEILRATRENGFLKAIPEPRYLGHVSFSGRQAKEIARLLKDEAGLLGSVGSKSRRGRSPALLVMGAALGLSSIASLWFGVIAARESDRADIAESYAVRLVSEMAEILPSATENQRLVQMAEELSSDYLNGPPQTSASDAARHVQILLLIGEAKDLTGEIDEARDAFTRAFQVADRALEQWPDHVPLWFQKSQSAFWVSNAAYRSGDLSRASQFTQIYLDAAERMVELEPGSAVGIAETGHALSNLAAIRLEEGKPSEAVSLFERSLDAFQSGPIEAGLIDNYDVGNLAGWQSETYESLGRLGEAAQAREAEISLYLAESPTLTSDPGAYWELTHARGSLSELRMMQGRRDAGVALLEEALHDAEALYMASPDNSRHSRLFVELLMLRAQAALDDENLIRGQLLIDELSRLSATNNVNGEDDLRFITESVVHRLRAEIALANGVTDRAAAESTRAFLIAERAIDAGFLSARRHAARAYFIHAEALSLGGDIEEARQSYRAVLALTESQTEQTSLPARDLQARSLYRLGELARSTALIEELEASGYASSDFLEFWAQSELAETASAATASER